MAPEPSSVEEAVDLWMTARRAGDAEDPRAFAARHPGLAPELLRALEALLALENLARADERLSARGSDRAAEERPERIGGFRILREIGRGGMGVVFEAVEEELGRRVALKVLPSELLASSSARQRFRREAALAARLDHPGIATVYGAGVADGQPWIAMRCVDGRTLAAAVAEARGAGERCVRLGRARAGRTAVLEVAACAAAVARALHFAHERGVVHRDVKPSNIAVTLAGEPMLLDFGLATLLEPGEASLTRTGDTPGTPSYLAPEIVSGEIAQPDAQGDVYALGVTLYECLTTRKPFEAPTLAAIYGAVLFATPPSVRVHNRDVPSDLAVVVATALERDRARRYRDAAALAADLEACTAGRPISARPVPFHGRVLRWARREPRQAVLAALFALALIVGASFAGTWWASRDKVLAADRATREQELETAIADGYSLMSARSRAEAQAAFARALALEPRSTEAQVGRILLDLDTASESEQSARLAALPAGMRGRETLERLVARRPLAPPPAGPALEGATAFELSVLGLCWQREANRTPVSQRAPLYRAALQSFTEAILRAPVARPLYYEQRALAAQLAGDAHSARSVASALIALWPDSPRGLYAAGRALHTFDPPDARRLLERAIALDAGNADAYVVLAITCCQIGEFEDAERWCSSGLVHAPGNANLHFWSGQSLMFRDCQDEARAAFERAARLDPAHSGLWAQVGLYALLAREPALAVERYGHALALDDQNHRARVFLAAALELAGDAQGARREIDAAVAGLWPGESGYWIAAAEMLEQIGAPETARVAADAGR